MWPWARRPSTLAAAPSKELLEHLQSQSQRMAGRVGFVWLDGHGSPESPQVDSRRPARRARPCRSLRRDPAPLRPTGPATPRPHVDRTNARPRLGAFPLGRPRVELRHPGGRVLEADGTLVVGPRQAAAGLISRRSQLRALKGAIDRLEGKIAQAEAAVADVQAADRPVSGRTSAANGRISPDAGRCRRASLGNFHGRGAPRQFDQQRSALDERIASRQCESTRPPCAAWRKPGKSAPGSTRTWRRRNTRLAGLAEQIAALEAQRQASSRETTEAKVELAKSEERLRSLHARLRQIEDGRQERTRALADGQEQLAQCVLRARRAVGTSFARNRRSPSFTSARKRSPARRSSTSTVARPSSASGPNWPPRRRKIRGKIRKLEERIHAQDLAANELRHERTTLVERLREDYGIDLAEVEHQSVDQQEHEREAVQEEIDDLRRKINAIGSVNLEALEELESLEARHENLSGQFKDLSNAKAALEKIIEKINADSRRLFAETLQTVREHFQSLFRDLFGGGHADIVLEEAVDILESGVEIVARPPGKEPRSISLLSGGEKTLTCVALLLAIFRSRPSPFCVLDEVDAALDEANIDRFTKVLRDFLAWTQFIIVTHSKKTMTCADTIYGVTMQESGVSKQVSVRFEDVSDDGRILSTPPAAEDKTQAA